MKTIFFGFIIVMLFTISNLIPIYAETSIITTHGKYHALVEYETGEGVITEGDDEGMRIVYFFERLLLIEDKDSAFVDPNENLGIREYRNDLEIGKQGKYDYNVLILFDLEKIPKSNWLEKVTIDSVKMTALVQNIPEFTENANIITIGDCHNDGWYLPYVEKFVEYEGTKYFRTEYDLHLNQKYVDHESGNEISPCSYNATAKVSNIINSNELPEFYSWDVTESVISYREKEIPTLTFVIVASPLSEDGNLDYSKDSILRLVSFKIKQEGNLGLNFVPSFKITYITSPSLFVEIIVNGVVIWLPVVSIIIPGIWWFYKKQRKELMKQRIIKK